MKPTQEVESAMTAGQNRSPCPGPSGAGHGGRGGALVSGALGAGLLAAALAFPAGEAQARDECGALSSGAATCSNQAYASGIRYDVTDGWGNGIAGDITLTVTGGAATAITSATATGWGSGIVLRTAHHASETRTIALTVGSGSNNVDITQSAATITGGFDDTGVVLHQRAIGASPTTAILGGGVDIGTSSAPMQRSGIHVLVENGGNTGTHTITSAATIHSAEFGIIMDNRGASDTVITNSGSITTTTAGGSTSNKSGIRILDWSHNPAGGSYGGDSRTADTTATVTNSGSITVSGADARGIEVDAMGLGLYKVVNSGSGTKGITASGAGGHGVMVVATWHTGAAGSTAVEIENSGRITTSGVNGLGIYVETVGATGLTATQHKGDVEISNSGSISSANTAVIVNANMGAVSVTHSGGSIASSAFDGIRIQQGGTGAATVASGADVTAKRWGVFVDQQTSAGAASVTHSAGAIAAETESGVHAQNAAGNADEVKVEVTGGSVKSDGQSKAAVSILQRGTGDAVAGVSDGATLTSKHNAGIYADLSNGSNVAGQIKITQSGTISGRKGIYARVGRASATSSETRDPMKQSVIDVTWTGAFARGTGTAENDNDRFLPSSVAHAIAVAQEVETEKAMRDGSGFLRYGSPAGIEAQVMSWREVMTAVAKGDDPGAFADAAAVTALFDSGADAATQAQAAAVIAAFRAALANEDLDTIPGAAAIDTDGTAGLSDDEIETYLSVDDAARRTLLRNVLAQGFMEEEKAVLRAVATNTGLDAALDDEDAGFSADYKTAVRGLLDRFNVGNIRVAMDGGPSPPAAMASAPTTRRPMTGTAASRSPWPRTRASPATWPASTSPTPGPACA